MHTIKEKLGVIPIKTIAKQSGFEKRRPKKINCEDYISSFVQCVLNGDISQASWCRELSKQTGKSVSEQALQGKVQVRHEEFSSQVLASAIEHTMQNNVEHASCKILSSFKSVKLHDSTCVKMPIGLIDSLPGSSSRNGQNAMARIQLTMDLLKNSYSKIAITSFRKNDQSYSLKIAEDAKKGELHLFDLGYFNKKLLVNLNKKEASFLCRYFNVSLFELSDNEKDAQAIDLVSQLKKLDKQGITKLDRQLKMGRKEGLPIRIVAIKLPQNIAQARARKRKKVRKQDARKAYNADYLYLLQWNIYFTNLPADILSVKEIFRIYRLRWRIEIIFKAWKSKFDLVRMFAKQQYGLPSRAIIQINLILMTIVLFLTKWYQLLFHLVEQKTGKRLSLLKFSAMIKNDFVYLVELYEKNRNKLIDILQRQYCYDLRKDRPNFVEILYNKKLS